MLLQIKEFAELTGVSVRTLRYYDEIGLLKPCRVDEWTGYRFYDEASLERMQEILFYRELDFPLKRIPAILASPAYDKQTALAAQRQLLLLKKERLERLIAALDDTMEGNSIMKALEKDTYESTRRQYEAEAKEKWGNTAAYREYEEKTAEKTEETRQDAASGMEAIFERFAECVRCGADPADEAAQKLVEALQAHITEQYYACTDEILASLGEMYTADERFRQNIDRHAPGTAAFVSAAIAAYCR